MFRDRGRTCRQKRSRTHRQKSPRGLVSCVKWIFGCRLDEGKTLLESSTQEVHLAGPAAAIPASSSGLSWAPFPRPGHQLGAAQLLAFPAQPFDLLPPGATARAIRDTGVSLGKPRSLAQAQGSCSMSEVLSISSTHNCHQVVWVPSHPHPSHFLSCTTSRRPSCRQALEHLVQSSLIQPSSCEAGAVEPAGGANEAWRGTVFCDSF